MADIQNKNSNQPGVKKQKLRSTRVDLTPMVDLGFLLITFFVFTTSISKPTAMKINLPENKNVKDPTLTAEGKTINLIPGDHDQLFYYDGSNSNNMHVTNYSAIGMRAVLQQKKNAVQSKYGDAGEMVVLIKPMPGCSYKNLVDVLDEMQINMIGTYVLMDIHQEEKNNVNLFAATKQL